MKRILLSLIVACLIGCLPMYADGNDNKTIGSDNRIPIEVKYPTIPSNPGRPKVPSKQHIECWYCDGELSFDFVIPEGECTLYVTNYATGFMTQYTFDSADHADVYVGIIMYNKPY